jgi:hypothetical protein
MRGGRQGVPASGFGCPISRVLCKKWGLFAASDEKIPTLRQAQGRFSRKQRKKWRTRAFGEAEL